MQPALLRLLLLDDTKIQRVIPFAPDDLSGLQLWLRADQISGLSDGDLIQTWDDESGNGRDATQATEAARPSYQTNEINGLPVVRFDGSDDKLVVSHNAALQLGTGFTLFAVVLSSDTNVSASLIGKYNTSNWVLQLNSDAATTAGLVYARQASPAAHIDVDTTGDVTDGSVHVIMYLWDNSDLFAFYDGTSSAAEALNDNNATTQDIEIGANGNNQAFGAMDLGEIVIYHRELNSAEIDQVEAYLGAKWGVTIA